MLSFTEFLNEAKLPSFNSYAKETFSIMSKLPKFSVARKLSLNGKADRESANFKIFKYLGEIGNSLSHEDKKKEYDKYNTEFEKVKKSILLLLGCTPAVANAQHRVNWKNTSQGWKEEQTISFTDTKNAYNVVCVATLYQDFQSVYMSFEVELTGAEIQSQTVFVDYPQFVPGVILHSTHGYSMTMNTFYEIVKRSGKTIYCVELGKKIVKGDGWTGEEIPVKEQKGKEVFRCIIRDAQFVKIDGNHARVWNGKPAFYDHAD